MSQLNEYNKLKMTSTSELAIDIYIILGININSSTSADKRESTGDLPTLSDFTNKNLLTLKLAGSYLAIQESPKRWQRENI